MNDLYLDIPRIYTALAEWLACSLFVLGIRRRYSAAKTVGIAGLMLVVQSVFLVVTDPFVDILWIAAMVIAFGLMVGYLYIAGDLSVFSAVYCAAGAFIWAEFAASLEWQIHEALRLGTGINRGMEAALLIVCYALVYGLSYCLLRTINIIAYLEQLSKKEMMATVMIAILIFTFSNLSFVISDSPFTSDIMKDIYNIRTLVDLAGIAILYGYQQRICEYIAEKELVSMKAMLKRQYDQYRGYQDSIERMHIMYHDLKHQVAGLRGEQDEQKRKEWLDAIEEELEDNRIPAPTGNPVLDTIIGAKLLYAKQRGIRVTCVADGSLLRGMHVTDICNIFGNALDNAMEHVSLIEDETKRLIHVQVAGRRNFVLIQISNYCSEELHLEKGQLPETTKQDKDLHGFGLKSIRYAAEKYGGTVTIDVKDHWFELRVLIPE